MGLQTGSNVTAEIGTTAAAADAAAYATDTYVIIGGTESVSEYGDSSAEVTFTGASEGRTQKLKGARDAGNVTISMGFLAGDAGQAALAAAEADDSSANYNFRITYSDGEVRYFSGQVASLRENPGGANNVLMLTSEIRINTAITKVAAP
ncbi:MAG: phage tail tube protein [Pseudomonadota bacterium]